MSHVTQFLVSFYAFYYGLKLLVMYTLFEA
uniref:Uncharacterized protein n=1 Tax=Anguilla anguilla TaxID=7936 RepID=A0A0E9SNQ5_ANGAN